MQKSFGKDTNEFKFFMDYWKLIQEYAEPEPDDKFWESATRDFTKLYEKYQKQIFFAKQLCVGYLDALSDRRKGMNEKRIQNVDFACAYLLNSYRMFRPDEFC